MKKKSRIKKAEAIPSSVVSPVITSLSTVKDDCQDKKESLSDPQIKFGVELPSKPNEGHDYIALETKVESPPTYIAPSNKWECQFEAVAGTSHRNKIPALPCQDAAISAIHPKPFVIVADGAGSSMMSDVGAQAVVMALSRLLETLEQEVAILLDQDQQTEEKGRRFALMLVKHARGVLIDLAQTQRRAIKDFRCTLLLAIVGKTNLLWLKVGDGAIIQEKIRSLLDGSTKSELRTLGEVGKGDFANETTFIDDSLRIEDVKSGFLPAGDICGLAAMSDGAALALVSHDGTKVAQRLETWLNELRSGKLKKSILTASFYDSDFSRRAMGDDCSIALVASALPINYPLSS